MAGNSPILVGFPASVNRGFPDVPAFEGAYRAIRTVARFPVGQNRPERCRAIHDRAEVKLMDQSDAPPSQGRPDRSHVQSCIDRPFVTDSANIERVICSATVAAVEAAATRIRVFPRREEDICGGV
jgi:hypothetical protein